MKKLLIGDCIEMMKTLPEKSVHTCVTSPPYFGLRDYGVDGQIGLEETPDAFVARLVDAFREVHRVLRDDGTLWVNLGDSYVASPTGNFRTKSNLNGIQGEKYRATIAKGHETRRGTLGIGLPQKNLIGIPWRVAFALQADGWYLRQDIIWAKPNQMPESVTDRCTKSHEYIFLFSKGLRYFFDSEAIKEEAVGNPSGNTLRKSRPTQQSIQRGDQPGSVPWAGGSTRNRRSVWTVTTKPFKGAHFATFPPDLIEPCILAGAPEQCCSACGAPLDRIVERGKPDIKHQIACGGDANGNYSGQSTKDYAAAGAQDASSTKARILAGMVKKTTVGFRRTCACLDAEARGGIVLDPFFGAGTTGLTAQKNGRGWVGIELNPDYARIAEARLGMINKFHVWLCAA